MKLRLIGFTLILVTLIADQLSKAAILSTFASDPHRHIELLPIFDLVLWWNRGVSFGMLTHEHDTMPWLLTGVALVVAAGLTVWLWRNHRLIEVMALGLVIGGAIGNAIDRLRFGAVVDFLYLHYGSWYWPAFNIADSAICVGVVMMVIFGHQKSVKAAKPVGSSPENA